MADAAPEATPEPDIAMADAAAVRPVASELEPATLAAGAPLPPSQPASVAAVAAESADAVVESESAAPQDAAPAPELASGGGAEDGGAGGDGAPGAGTSAVAPEVMAVEEDGTGDAQGEASVA